jgi:hypothetical protein
MAIHVRISEKLNDVGWGGYYRKQMRDREREREREGAQAVDMWRDPN